jgi:hypothetical protein
LTAEDVEIAEETSLLFSFFANVFLRALCVLGGERLSLKADG